MIDRRAMTAVLLALPLTTVVAAAGKQVVEIEVTGIT